MQHSNCYARNVEMGQKRTLTHLVQMSALPPKADIAGRHRVSREAAVINYRVCNGICAQLSIRKYRFPIHFPFPIGTSVQWRRPLITALLCMQQQVTAGMGYERINRQHPNKFGAIACRKFGTDYYRSCCMCGDEWPCSGGQCERNERFYHQR